MKWLSGNRLPNTLAIQSDARSGWFSWCWLEGTIQDHFSTALRGWLQFRSLVDSASCKHWSYCYIGVCIYPSWESWAMWNNWRWPIVSGLLPRALIGTSRNSQCAVKLLLLLKHYYSSCDKTFTTTLMVYPGWAYVLNCLFPLMFVCCMPLQLFEPLHSVDPHFVHVCSNVLSKHFGSLPHLLLRLVMTNAVRAICAGVLVCIQRQCPRRHSLGCCMSMDRGLDFCQSV